MSENPNLLNLDEVGALPLTKSIRLDGVDHKLAPVTVEKYLEQVSKTETAKKESEESNSPKENIEALIEMIHESFPTLAKTRLATLQVRQLYAIIGFITSSPEQDAALAQINKEDEAKPEVPEGTVGNGE